MFLNNKECNNLPQPTVPNKNRIKDKIIKIKEKNMIQLEKNLYLIKANSALNPSFNLIFFP